MATKKITYMFNKDKCDLCGLCFHKCPVLELPLDESKAEIQRLVNNEESKYVLNKCHTCFSCNQFCPNDANPYQLILQRWTEINKKRGTPPIYRFVCPTEEPNIWQLLNSFLTNKEQRWIYKWMNYKPKPDDSILLIGSYTRTVMIPYYNFIVVNICIFCFLSFSLFPRGFHNNKNIE